MKLGDSIKRLRFTLSKQNKPNQSDIDAFNSICSHLQKSEAEVNQDHLLFGKLYTYVLSNMLHHYSDINFANKRLNEILSQPMDIRIEELLSMLKHSELQKVFADPLIKDKSDIEVKDIFSRYPKFSQEFTACWDHWDKDNVIAHLNRNVNLSIQEYKNHV